MNKIMNNILQMIKEIVIVIPVVRFKPGIVDKAGCMIIATQCIQQHLGGKKCRRKLMKFLIRKEIPHSILYVRTSHLTNITIV